MNSREQARCVSNYVISIIENAITVGLEIGVNNKRPEKYKDNNETFKIK